MAVAINSKEVSMAHTTEIGKKAHLLLATVAARIPLSSIKANKVLVTLALILGLAPLARAADYTFTTIDVPGSTGTADNANSPNAIAGQYDDAGGITHGFVLRHGDFTTIDVPNAASSQVNGISANGQIVGTYQDATRLHAYFLSDGVLTTLDPPGSVRSQGGFLNARGHVVGAYRSPDQKRHGFVWRSGDGFTSFVIVRRTPFLPMAARSRSI